MRPRHFASDYPQSRSGRCTRTWCFNEAEAFRLGLPPGRPDRRARCRRFNEAEAFRLGLHGAGVYSRAADGDASMRPRHFASDYRPRRWHSWPGCRGFNEAEAFRLGLPEFPPVSGSDSGASMRPRHFASDYPTNHQKWKDESAASMRPRHFASDYEPCVNAWATCKAPASMRPRHFASDYTPPSIAPTPTAQRFNEAEAFRLGLRSSDEVIG